MTTGQTQTPCNCGGNCLTCWEAAQDIEAAKPVTHALTLWPEWAWAITHLDKRVENRTWAPSAKVLPRGRWFALHAGAHLGGRKGKPATSEALQNVSVMAGRAGWQTIVQPGGSLVVHRPHISASAALLDLDQPDVHVLSDEISRGSIVALVQYRGARIANAGSGDWKVPGMVAWRLHVRVLPQPIPCKGAQGLWSVSPDHQREIEAAMQQAGQ